jgi:hypothetical protein
VLKIQLSYILRDKITGEKRNKLAKAIRSKYELILGN